MPRTLRIGLVCSTWLVLIAVQLHALPAGSAPELAGLIDRVVETSHTARTADLDRARARLLDCVRSETDALRLATLEALVCHIEAMDRRTRAAFVPLKDPLTRLLADAGASARGGRLFVTRLSSLGRRIETALDRVETVVSAAVRSGPSASPPPAFSAPRRPAETSVPTAVIPPPSPPPPSPPTPVHPPAEAATPEPVPPTPTRKGPIPVLVSDFTQRGRISAASLAASDLLARSLSASGRYRVGRVPQPPAGTDAFIVDGEIFGLRACVFPRVFYNPLWGGPLGGWWYGGWGLPLEAGSAEVTVSLDGRIRIVEGWSGRVIADRRIGSTTSAFVATGFFPTLGYQDLMLDDTAGRVLESTILDRKEGAVRYVLDSLPLTGRIARVDSNPAFVLADLGTTQGIRAGDRFVVISAASGNETTILRAEGSFERGLARLRISGPEHHRGSISTGDSVISRGY